ncbi:MAG: hypothetical protein P4L73_07230 [Caulobacteraceae bacterium]|nr:hypothetical protein [Caulobacteraceae bacterium]
MNRHSRAFTLAALGLALALALGIGPAAPALSKPGLQVPPLFELRQRPPQPSPPQPSLVFAYRGWRVDAARAARAQPAARTVRQIRAQIDLVERLDLRPDVMAFMRSQPIYGDGLAAAGAEAGAYAPGGGVVLHVRRLDPKKPTLLYALLKAYQAQRLPGGLDNPDVAGLRRQSAARHVWPRDALMLQGNDEFFALTAAAYLYGTITREPYTRADLKKTEPQCYQWLANLFDGGRPRV